MEMKAPKTTAQPQPPSGGVQPRLDAAAGDMFPFFGQEVETSKKCQTAFQGNGNDHMMVIPTHTVSNSQALTSAQSLKLCCPGYEPCRCAGLQLCPTEKYRSQTFDLIMRVCTINTSDHTHTKKQ